MGSSSNLDTVTEMAKSLSDPTRVRALAVLRDGELCVCQLIELFGLAPSTVSKHMTILKQAGLVESRKDSRWVYYRLKQVNANSSAFTIMQQVYEFILSDAQVHEDTKTIAEIREKHAAEACPKP